MAIQPTGTGTIGKILDGRELEEEVALQAPALGIAVALVVLHLSQRVGHLGTEIPAIGHNILVLVEAAILVIGRQQRTHGQQVTDAVTIDTTYAYTFLISSREGDVLAKLEHVATFLADERVIGVKANGIAIVLRIGRIADGTRLVILTET